MEKKMCLVKSVKMLKRKRAMCEDVLARRPAGPHPMAADADADASSTAPSNVSVYHKDLGRGKTTKSQEEDWVAEMHHHGHCDPLWRRAHLEDSVDKARNRNWFPLGSCYCYHRFPVITGWKSHVVLWYVGNLQYNILLFWQFFIIGTAVINGRLSSFVFGSGQIIYTALSHLSRAHSLFFVKAAPTCLTVINFTVSTNSSESWMSEYLAQKI